MATIEYSLFRANFIKPAQTSLFNPDLSSGDVFWESIAERPSAELSKGHVWHIGNLRRFPDMTGYFAIGRTTKATVEKFDESTRNFVEEQQETSPYTHCVFNAPIGLIGIAMKTSLARTTNGTARRLEKLLSHSAVVSNNSILVQILPIPDPDGFLRALGSAYQVTRFAATFHGPNPFDADEQFQKPLSVYLSAANGTAGKARVSGVDLNRDVLAAVTRSTAATGNEASARIRRSKHQEPITINLRGDALKRTYEESEHRPETVIEDLTEMYRHVRQDDRG